MNVVVLITFIALAVNIASSKEFSSTVGARVLDNMAHQLFTIIRSIDKSYAYSAPSYRDSITFENQQVDLCGPILCISANLTKGSLAGIDEYEVVKLDFNSDGTNVDIDIDIHFPKLQLNADYYTMKGNIMAAIPLSGEGKLHFQTTDLRVWTKILLRVSDHTSIESFKDSGFSVNSILSRTEFDGNIDDVFNAMVNELLAEHLNRFNKAIAAQCGTLLIPLLNPILN